MLANGDLIIFTAKYITYYSYVDSGCSERFFGNIFYQNDGLSSASSSFYLSLHQNEN